MYKQKAVPDILKKHQVRLFIDHKYVPQLGHNPIHLTCIQLRAYYFAMHINEELLYVVSNLLNVQIFYKMIYMHTLQRIRCEAILEDDKGITLNRTQ